MGQSLNTDGEVERWILDKGARSGLGKNKVLLCERKKDDTKG